MNLATLFKSKSTIITQRKRKALKEIHFILIQVDGINNASFSKHNYTGWTDSRVNNVFDNLRKLMINVNP